MIQSGVGVWVANAEHGSKKEEFVPPRNSPLYSADPNEAYIEAVDDEPFKIIVRCLNDFQSHGATDIMVELDIDASSIRAKEGVTLDHGDPSLEIESVDMRKNGTEQECGFVFNTMTLDEELFLPKDEVTRQVSRLGCIRVTVFRGYCTPITGVPDDYCLETPVDSAVVSSRQVIKVNGVTHSIKTPSLAGRTPELVTHYDFRPLKGKHAKVGTFTFRYRSLMSLDIKKVIDAKQAEALHAQAYALEAAKNRASRESQPSTQQQVEQHSSFTRETRTVDASTRVQKRKRDPHAAAEEEDLDRGVEEIDHTDPDDAPTKARRKTSSTAEVSLDELSTAEPMIQPASGKPALTSFPSSNARSAEKERLRLQLQKIEIEQRLLELEEKENDE